MRIRHILTSFLLILTSIALSATEDESYHFVSGEFQPFTSEQMTNGGLTTEIIQSVVENMGKTMKVSYLPWKRGHLKTLNGDFYAIYPYSKNPERLKIWHYSEALYELEEIFFRLKGKTFDYTSNSDLQGLTVCKPTGYNLFGLKKLFEEGLIKLERPPDLKSCFRMLNIGRVDLVMTNATTAWSMIDSLGLDAAKFDQVDKPFEKINHHLIIPKSNLSGKSFLKGFNDVLTRLKAEGKVQNILDKHL